MRVARIEELICTILYALFTYTTVKTVVDDPKRSTATRYLIHVGAVAIREWNVEKIIRINHRSYQHWAWYSCPYEDKGN